MFRNLAAMFILWLWPFAATGTQKNCVGYFQHLAARALRWHTTEVTLARRRGSARIRRRAVVTSTPTQTIGVRLRRGRIGVSPEHVYDGGRIDELQTPYSIEQTGPGADRRRRGQWGLTGTWVPYSGAPATGGADTRGLWRGAQGPPAQRWDAADASMEAVANMQAGQTWVFPNRLLPSPRK